MIGVASVACLLPAWNSTTSTASTTLCGKTYRSTAPPGPSDRSRMQAGRIFQHLCDLPDEFLPTHWSPTFRFKSPWSVGTFLIRPGVVGLRRGSPLPALVTWPLPGRPAAR